MIKRQGAAGTNGRNFANGRGRKTKARAAGPGKAKCSGNILGPNPCLCGGEPVGCMRCGAVFPGNHAHECPPKGAAAATERFMYRGFLVEVTADDIGAFPELRTADCPGIRDLPMMGARPRMHRFQGHKDHVVQGICRVIDEEIACRPHPLTEASR